MKKKAFLIAMGTIVSANEGKEKESLWRAKAALGVTVPFKQIYIGTKGSKGFSVQLEGLFRARKDNGLSLFAGAAVGPFFSEDFKVHESHGLSLNENFCRLRLDKFHSDKGSDFYRK